MVVTGLIDQNHNILDRDRSHLIKVTSPNKVNSISANDSWQYTEENLDEELPFMIIFEKGPCDYHHFIYVFYENSIFTNTVITKISMTQLSIPIFKIQYKLDESSKVYQNFR